MCCLASCGISLGTKVDADKFLITGRVANVPDSTEILVLQEVDSRLLETVMKDTIVNGMFTFSDTTSCVKKFLLLSNQSPKANEIFSLLPLGISFEPDFIILNVYLTALSVVPNRVVKSRAKQWRRSRQTGAT